MKTIKKIFWTDVKNLAKNIFALIIAVGVCFLPALYAWFNIYSNWDPYGNTGSLQLAAVSLDEGFTNEDGTYSGYDNNNLLGTSSATIKYIPSAMGELGQSAIEVVEIDTKYYKTYHDGTYSEVNIFKNSSSFKKRIS